MDSIHPLEYLFEHGVKLCIHFPHWFQTKPLVIKGLRRVSSLGWPKLINVKYDKSTIVCHLSKIGLVNRYYRREVHHDLTVD